MWQLTIATEGRPTLCHCYRKIAFGAQGCQRPDFDGFIYIRYAAAPYSALISAIYLLPFDTVWLGSVC